MHGKNILTIDKTDRTNSFMKKLAISSLGLILFSSAEIPLFITTNVKAEELTQELLDREREKGHQYYIDQFNGGYIYEHGEVINKPDYDYRNQNKTNTVPFNNTLEINNINDNVLNETSGNNTNNYDVNTIFQLKGVITVNNPDGNFCQLYSFNAEGQPVPVSNRALSNHTLWYTDKYRKFNNEYYSRVATNEWVKNSLVTLFSTR